MALGTTTAALVTRVHTLLNQDPNDQATSRITDAFIIDYFNEALDVACVEGKICKISRAINTIVTTGLITVSSALEDLTTCAGGIYVVNIENILYAGEALTMIDRKDRGKYFTIDELSGASGLMWWYEYGGVVYTLPLCATATAVVVEHAVKPKGILTSGSPTPPDFNDLPSLTYLDRKFYNQLVNWAVYRGKQAYNAHNEAATYQQQFYRGIGVDIADLKSNDKEPGSAR
jgi:hypothetical protein